MCFNPKFFFRIVVMPRSSHFSLSCWARCLKIESDSWRFSLPENYCNWSSCITPNIASEILEKWYPWIKKSWNNEYSCDAVLLTVKTSLKHWIPTWILVEDMVHGSSSRFILKFKYCWNSEAGKSPSLESLYINVDKYGVNTESEYFFVKMNFQDNPHKNVKEFCLLLP